MPSFFKPVNAQKLKCAVLFASQNDIEQEPCFKLMIMPYAMPNSWLPWQSLQFSFNKDGQIVAFDAIFMHHESDYLQLVNEVIQCIATTKTTAGQGKVMCEYDDKKRQLSLPYWGKNQQDFSSALIQNMLALFRVDDAFKHQFLDFVFDGSRLALEHQRLTDSLPEPIQKSICPLM